MRLREHHYRAISMILQGAKNSEVAEQLGVAETTIRWWRHNKDFEDEIVKQRDAMREAVTQAVTGRLLTESPPSLDKMVHLRDHARSERVQLSAAEGILNKAGFKEVERVERVTTFAVSPELLEAVRLVTSEMHRLPQRFSGVMALPERGQSNGGPSDSDRDSVSS